MKGKDTWPQYLQQPGPGQVKLESKALSLDLPCGQQESNFLSFHLLPPKECISEGKDGIGNDGKTQTQVLSGVPKCWLKMPNPAVSLFLHLNAEIIVSSTLLLS